MENRPVILITGAAKRLGRLLALDLSDRGAKIAVHYKDSEEAAHQLVKEIRQKEAPSAAFHADLTSKTQIDQMVDQVIETFGRIDVLINNASVFYKTPFGQVTEQDWDRLMDTNLKGPFFCAQAVGRQMLQQSRLGACSKIITISDSEGPQSRKQYQPYWISKAALSALTETLAQSFTPHILVNSIAPGPLAFAEDHSEIKNQMPVDPFEVVKTVRFLVEEANAITGNTFVIDNGRRYH